MKLRDRVASVFEGLARRLDTSRIAASGTPNSADTPENEGYWRKLGTITIRDITPQKQRAAQDDAASAFQRFSIARRATAVIRGFTVGAGGVRPKAKVERVQVLLDQFWDDRDNRVEDRVGEWTTDLSVYGELCLVLAVGRDAKGLGSQRTKVSVLDVGRVDQVVTDPEDASRILGVIVVEKGNERRIHPVVTGTGELPPEFAGLTKGQMYALRGESGTTQCRVADPCIWTRVNALATQARGLPDMYPALDALALRDRSLFSFMERISLIGAFVWDLMLPTSKTPKQVAAEATNCAKAVGSGTGGVYAHTSNMTLSAQAPDIKAADWTTALRMPFVDILTAVGHPEHWYAGGPEMSNASAGEIGSPTWAALQERQLVIKRTLIQLGTFALRQFPETASLDTTFDISLPVIAGKDAVREITVLNSELNALSQMRDLGLTEEAVQREAQARANEYGFTLSDTDWGEAPTLTGLPFPDRKGPLNPSAPDPERDAGARVDPEGHPSDSKPQMQMGAPGKQAA